MTTKTGDKLRALIRDVASFERKVELLQAEGLSRGKSLMFVRKCDPDGYNLFARRRQNQGLVTAQTL